MKLEVLVVSVFFICSLSSGISLAQNKVVVIPLYSGDDDCSKIQTVTSAGQVWMDRNLGAFRVAQSDDDYQAYGWLYQWGRFADGHEIRSSPTTITLSSGDIPGHGDYITTSSSPYDWRDGQNDNLWQGVSGTNNPCPAGFRLPTESEWKTEVNSWSTQDAAGAFASPLKLVLAGFRNISDGTVKSVSFQGNYWCSTAVGNVNKRAYRLFFSYSNAYLGSIYRANGTSVRCLKD